MAKIDVAGLKVDALAKQELLTIIQSRMRAGQKTWITTLYSEFLYAALEDRAVLEMLNKADFAVADGIGIFWAAKYLSIPLTAKNYWLKILQALWQIKYSLAAIVFNPKWVKSAFPEKIVGADLIWDLAKLAADNNLSIYLLGGFKNTPELVKQKLISRYPNISISASNKNPDDPSIINDVNYARADLLFVAFGPIEQEKWIAENLPKLKLKLAIGVGGTFDYIAGKKSAPPKFIRYAGLEWLYRLITQPFRLKRIINATFGLITRLMRYKIFNSYSIRKNSVAVIINNQGEVLLGRKTGSRVDIISSNEPEKWKNYWQFPQGGIEENEDAADAVIREAKEETGIKNLVFLKFSQKNNTYIWNNALRRLLGKNRNYKFKGQTQTIAYLKFTDGQNIQLPPNEEFVDYKWVKAEDLDKIVHPERASLTKIVQEDLKEFEKELKTA